MGGDGPRNQAGEVRHTIQMGAGIHVFVVYDVGGRSHGSLERPDRGQFGNRCERGEVPEDIQIVQDLIGEHALEPRVEEDESKEGSVQKHRQGIAGPVSRGAYMHSMFGAAAFEDIEVVDNPRCAACHRILQGRDLGEFSGIVPQWMSGAAAVDVGLEKVRLRVIDGDGNARNEWIPPLQQFMKRRQFVGQRIVAIEGVECVPVVENGFVAGGSWHGGSLARAARSTAKELNLHHSIWMAGFSQIPKIEPGGHLART